MGVKKRKTFSERSKQDAEVVVPKAKRTTGSINDDDHHDHHCLGLEGGTETQTDDTDGAQCQKPEHTMNSPCSESSDVYVIEISAWKLRVIVAATLLLFLAVAILLVLPSEDSSWSASPEDFQKMGKEALALFRQHDINDDGLLSLGEFEPLAHILVDVNVSISYDLDLKLDENIITLEAHFTPLHINSTKGYTDGFSDEKLLRGLKQWKEPVAELKNFPTQLFSVFLPGDEHILGSPYLITPFGLSEDPNERYAHLPSSRYYPPRLADVVIPLHHLLSMFHPRPFIHSRFPPQGSLACLRAYNSELFDISFRIHAEFQLHEPPSLPFWFTPAQFKGRIVISKDQTKIQYFRLWVPNNRLLNVDMEWLRGSEEHNMEVDIGFMPQMELRSTGPSRPAGWDGKDHRNAFRMETTPSEDYLNDITWTKEVQVDECERAMELKFYPFKSVPYYNYTEAFDVAFSEKKLVHTIVLWGALDDQSC